MDGTLAEIRMFAGNFAPRGWQYCNGQLLSIAQWTAVFALVGTTYGGDGQVTFGIPDLRGRIPVGAQNSQGPGLPPVQLGEVSGTATTTLNINNLPVHNHTIAGGVTRQAAADGALSSDARDRYLGAGSFYSTANDNVVMAQIPATGLSLAVAGSNQPFDNMKPYLGMNYIICVEGIFPSRN
jgi:microcystin-dependent protein